MNRIAHLAVVVALAAGAQSVSAQEINEGSAVTVAEVSAPSERSESARSSQYLSSGRSMLIELGFSPGDGFPQRGGPLDD